MLTYKILFIADGLIDGVFMEEPPLRWTHKFYLKDLEDKKESRLNLFYSQKEAVDFLCEIFHKQELNIIDDLTISPDMDYTILPIFNYNKQ